MQHRVPVYLLYIEWHHTLCHEETGRTKDKRTQSKGNNHASPNSDSGPASVERKDQFPEG